MITEEDGYDKLPTLEDLYPLGYFFNENGELWVETGAAMPLPIQNGLDLIKYAQPITEEQWQS